MVSCTSTLSAAVFTQASSLCCELGDQLCDDAQSSTLELASCSLATLPVLRACLGFLHGLGRDPVHRDVHLAIRYQRLCMDTDAIFELANEEINAVPFALVDKKWLRLYTDSSLMRSLLDLFAGPDDEQDDPRIFWREAVRRLDMTIIVAGAVGDKRRIWVLALISLLQEVGLPRLKRQKSASEVIHGFQSASAQKPDPLKFASQSIPVFEQPPDLDMYVKQHCRAPFIVRGYAGLNDKAFQVWTAIDRWGSAEYILDAVGEGRYVPVEVGEAYDEEGWGQKIIPIRSFLARAGFDCQPETEFSLDPGETEDIERPLYLAQHSLFLQFPQLEKDFAIPEYVWSGPPIPGDVPDYKPPELEEGVILNVWIGSGRGEIISPPHTDPYYNCYTQVLGRKRVWLAPPAAGPFMQAHGQHVEEQHQQPSLASTYMTNTSTVPILRRGFSEDSIRVQHPQFAEKVFPASMEAVLEPGDLLVMPPGWWHAMRGEGEGPGWSISMWY